MRTRKGGRSRAGLYGRAAALGAGLALAGCTVGPNFHEPSAWWPVNWFTIKPQPKTAPSQAVAAPIDPDWWTLFHDPELTALERRVADSNLDVRTATIRLAESREQRRIVSAAEFPTVNANASYARERVSSEGVFSLANQGAAPATEAANGAGGLGPSAPTGGSHIPTFNLWQGGFDTSWELDLWGRLRRQIESANAQIDVSAEARRSTLVSVLAEVARDYIQLRGTQRELAIARENLGIARQSLSLTKERATAGLTSDLDVANAAAQVATVSAQIPQLQQQESQLINRLSFLLGAPPGTLASELDKAKPIPPVPPKVPVGLPSELARRRPDIREAEANLHAATANIGVAVADFYPQVTLTGSFGLQSVHLSDLAHWAARQYAIGPGITLPIFEGGRLRATLHLRKAQQQEAAVAYQRTVLSAWHEVDDALTAYAAEQRRREQLAAAVTQNRRALDLARSRYKEGVTDFLTVLEVQRNLLAAEQAYAQSTTTVSTNLVSLYKALGGGWESTYPRKGTGKGKTKT